MHISDSLSSSEVARGGRLWWHLKHLKPLPISPQCKQASPSSLEGTNPVLLNAQFTVVPVAGGFDKGGGGLQCTWDCSVPCSVDTWTVLPATSTETFAAWTRGEIGRAHV